MREGERKDRFFVGFFFFCLTANRNLGVSSSQSNAYIFSDSSVGSQKREQAERARVVAATRRAWRPARRAAGAGCCVGPGPSAECRPHPTDNQEASRGLAKTNGSAWSFLAGWNERNAAGGAALAGAKLTPLC